ncbi:hypothetical protein [Rarobacter incanus]|uniref:Uncharacterized protein n=1 Tax=Rarobacter incanus TaxID=153494 RepID=A0A542SLG2_9MICO|nr:hypothetical protein [Rarobacter incanus]TQK75398.1 hypothetical protein FB389_0024 [Rarobacter incanus]
MTPAAHLERYLSSLIQSVRSETLSGEEGTRAASAVIVSIEHLVAQDIEAYTRRRSA